jgi:membrane protein implicated in regulation of membrane protease activity
MLSRGLFCAAAAVIVCAIGAALLQLAILIFSFSAPLAIIAIALLAVVLLRSLRRRMRASNRNRFGPRNPHSLHR